MAMFPSLMHDSLFGDLFDDPFFTGLRRVSGNPDTVVAGYAALKEEDIPAVAASLARAWRR